MKFYLKNITGVFNIDKQTMTLAKNQKQEFKKPLNQRVMNLFNSVKDSKALKMKEKKDTVEILILKDLELTVSQATLMGYGYKANGWKYWKNDNNEPAENFRNKKQVFKTKIINVDKNKPTNVDLKQDLEIKKLKEKLKNLKLNKTINISDDKIYRVPRKILSISFNDRRALDKINNLKDQNINISKYIQNLLIKD